MYHRCDCGMGYIVRCPDGRFVIIDGGLGEPGESEAFLEEIKAVSKDPKPVIALWIITHAHIDHFGVFTHLVGEHGSEFEIEHAAFRFPKAEKARGWSDTKDFYRAVEKIGKDKVITPAAGDSFNVGGCITDILFTEADLPDGEVYPINDTSIAFRLAFGRRRALFIGDGAAVQSSVLCNKYRREELKSDVFQVGHHGYWGGSPELHDMVRPSVLLWPAPDFRFPFIFSHPESIADGYLIPTASKEALLRLWRINGSLDPAGTVRVTGYSGKENFTINMSKFSELDDPWENVSDFISSSLSPAKGVIVREDFKKRDLYALHWSFINGGFYPFSPGNVTLDGKRAVIASGEKIAACQLIKDSQFGVSKGFDIVMKGVLERGEVFVQYSGDTPVLFESKAVFPLCAEYGKPFTLEISADPSMKKARVSLCGAVREEPYDPDRMKGVYVFLKDASLSLTYLECRVK